MNTIDKQRKFQETLLNIFYPEPQEIQPSQKQDGKEDQLLSMHEEDFNGYLLSDPFNDSEEENSPEDASDCGVQKLTRAQRKRLRRKKMKEAASQRRKIIGPLLPPRDGGEVLEDKQLSGLDNTPVCGIIISAAQESDIVKHKQRELCDRTADSKLKHRRKGKRLERITGDQLDVEVSH